MGKRRSNMSVKINKLLFRLHWWVLTIYGVVAIAFGLAAVFWPRITLAAFIYLFGGFALVSGIAIVCLSFVQEGSRKWVFLLGGFLSFCLGLLTLIWPQSTGLLLLYLVAAWLLIMGMVWFTRAFSEGGLSVRKQWAFALAGICSFLLGIFLAFRPASSILPLVWLIGIYSIVYGILLILRVVLGRNDLFTPAIERPEE
jgi:uncharacterized membrane protein HdeD (DUF308 family)